MNLKLYDTPGDFLTDNADFLREFEAAAQLSIGNAAAHRDEPCRPDLLFGRFEQDGNAALLFSYTAPYNLLLHAIDGDPAALSGTVLLADHLLKENIPIRGVNASKALCNAFFSAYCKPYRVAYGMDIMVLRELVEPPDVPGKARLATEADLPLVIKWHQAFYREVLHEEPPEDEPQRVRNFYEKQGLYVFETPESGLVSTAHTSSRELPHGVSVSGVYTPPEHRGHGYCQNTVAALCRDSLKNGADYVTLFVDKKNPFSNHVYAKLGFEVLEENFDCRMEGV